MTYYKLVEMNQDELIPVEKQDGDLKPVKQILTMNFEDDVNMDLHDHIDILIINYKDKQYKFTKSNVSES